MNQLCCVFSRPKLTKWSSIAQLPIVSPLMNNIRNKISIGLSMRVVGTSITYYLGKLGFNSSSKLPRSSWSTTRRVTSFRRTALPKTLSAMDIWSLLPASIKLKAVQTWRAQEVLQQEDRGGKTCREISETLSLRHIKCSIKLTQWVASRGLKDVIAWNIATWAVRRKSARRGVDLISTLKRQRKVEAVDSLVLRLAINASLQEDSRIPKKAKREPMSTTQQFTQTTHVNIQHRSNKVETPGL